MTRDQARAQTRAALLAAAEKLFLANGYQGTSLEEIAEAAGFSKGAVYSNFDSKEALFVQVNTTRDERHVQPLLDALSAGDDVESKLGALERWIHDSSAQDSEWIVVDTEFALVAHRTPGMAERLRVLHRENRERITEVIRVHSTAAGIVLSLDAEVIAEALIALLRGLALAHAIDPEVGYGLVVPVFRRLIGVDTT